MLAKIFRSYDVRGVYGQDVTEEVFDKIGNAFTRVTTKDILVARDPRVHSEKLMNAFMNGALRAERTVMNVGLLPLGCAYHWATSQNFDLAYVTASHLPKEWNGLKLFHAEGDAYMEGETSEIRQIVEDGKYFTGVRGVQVREEIEDVIDLYIRHVVSKVMLTEEEKKKAKTKILVDCGNGAAGILVKRLFNAAGFTNVDTIFEQPDGSFPNRASDPNEDPLNELKKRVGKYDFGVAFDGDCDRVVVVDKNGGKLAPENVAYIILGELLKTSKGKILANVECSKLVDDVAKKYGVPLVRFRVGHTWMLDTVAKEEGIFAAESSGHFVIPAISKFDDAITAALYFAYALARSGKSLEQHMKEMPKYATGRVNLDCADEKKFSIIERLKQKFAAEHSNVDTLDGIRVNLPNGWFLVRASNTEPKIRITMEADSQQSLEDIKNRFSAAIQNEIARN